jgi:hypothetical protein
MKEQEVFDMFKTIDGKLDKIAECRIDDLKAINAALEKKASIEKVDSEFKETKNMYRWIVGGACTVLLVLFGYVMVLNANISKIQTSIISLHATTPSIESMVKEVGGDK